MNKKWLIGLIFVILAGSFATYFLQKDKLVGGFYASPGNGYTASPGMGRVDADGNFYNRELGLYNNVSRTDFSTTERTITNFQLGHGFSEGGTGTMSTNTVDYIRGVQSVKLTTNGAGNANFISNTSISPVLDMTGKFPVIWLNISSTTNVLELWVYLSSDSAFTNRYTWKIEDDISQIKNINKWVRLTLPFGKATISGTPNRSAISAIRIRATDKSYGALEVNVGGLSSEQEPEEGIVAITFDDGWESQYTEAKKAMDVYGYKGTIYTIADYVGTTNYLTLNQLKSMQDDGWQIASHHQSDLTSLSAAGVETAILNTKNFLIKNGFTGSDDFAYPLGRYDESIVMPLIKKYFRSARTIASYDETTKPGDKYRMRNLLVANNVSTSTVYAAIDRARINKEFLPLTFHKIVTTPTVDTEYAITDFAYIMAYLYSSGIKVKTVGEVLTNQNSLGISNSNGFVGIGTSSPLVPLQVTTTNSNATTTLEVGKIGQTKGSCLKFYNVAGTATYCSISGTTFACSATSCQ